MMLRSITPYAFVHMIHALSLSLSLSLHLVPPHEQDADVDEQEEEEGNTPLHLAAISGCESCIKLLLEKSDEDAENNGGNTPLFLAAAKGHLAASLALIEGGADIDLSCKGKRMPIDASNKPHQGSSARISSH